MEKYVKISEVFDCIDSTNAILQMFTPDEALQKVLKNNFEMLATRIDNLHGIEVEEGQTAQLQTCANSPFSISFDTFKYCLDILQKTTELDASLNDIFSKYNQGTGDIADLTLPSIRDPILKLLEIITEDNEEWIDYWVFELEFGKLASEMKCTDADGKPIPLRTIEDLWTVLVKEKERKDKTDD